MKLKLNLIRGTVFFLFVEWWFGPLLCKMAPYLLPSSDVTSCKISYVTSCLKFCFVFLLVEWWFGPLLCKMAPYLQGVAVSSSVNTLAAVAVERYV